MGLKRMRRQDLYFAYYCGAVTGMEFITFLQLDLYRLSESFHHPTLWKISEANVFKSKVVNILKDMYADNCCCKQNERQLSEWFRVKTDCRSLDNEEGDK